MDSYSEPIQECEVCGALAALPNLYCAACGCEQINGKQEV
jgi:uncharacterized OB-fold protein